ncbi:hypothetical protein CVS30_01665 [Arthrobacter psychrolactophilus]|uniref:Uncharacterized protein n=1 Tax=Arthrobacter psychrolactophilus TaxID=92442 RepID=A0A2V5IVY3_9MICC|nr:hypothetical protein CVS30_01665 [Arthrobacter psychrolactophilus]
MARGPLAFPSVQGKQLVQGGDISYLPPWTEIVQLFMQPFLMAAVAILVLTTLRPVLRSAAAQQREIISSDPVPQRLAACTVSATNASPCAD